MSSPLTITSTVKGSVHLLPATQCCPLLVCSCLVIGAVVVRGIRTMKLSIWLPQDGVVHSAKEAFEAMSASGGWSVYTNKVARRISDGGTSSKLAHEMSL